MKLNKKLKQVFLLSKLEKGDNQKTISKFLDTDKPFMMAKFGANEIKAVLYPKLPFFIRPFITKNLFNNMKMGAGFFPADKKNIKMFSDLMLKDISELDVLGSWRIEEILLKKKLRNCISVPHRDLEPYFHPTPWSKTLKGKKVLVIHPFNTTIEKQYINNREKLFLNPNVLPEFQTLQTIKAIQTIAGNSSNFDSWFEALEIMKHEIEKKDFDIAIIGCGAYGFPLAAHIKRLGKKAIHLGGATQILFGIKGKRWIDNPDFNNIINNNFVSPDNKDKPQNALKVENGCYW